VIGVLGSITITNDLNLIAQKQKVGNQPIVVKAFESVEAIVDCHILYIAPANNSALSDAIKKTRGKYTLIVTDKEGSTNRGAGINFVLDGSKLRYEISKTNLDKSGLPAKSELFSLGILVN